MKIYYQRFRVKRQSSDDLWQCARLTLRYRNRRWPARLSTDHWSPLVTGDEM